jgi:outer membrane lipopolysaccharide assembly protein LptE/RlpB
MMKNYMALACATLLAACGPKLEGTYRDSMGVSSYTFDSGKVTVSAMGIGREMDYDIEDGKLKIITPEGTSVLNILEDGSIQGPMGVKLTKQRQ